MADRKFSLSNYPLAWPEGWQRTKSSAIKSARFTRNGGTPSIMEGLNRVLRELEKMYVKRDDILVSTNVPTRLDGMPRSDQREPLDRGVAVYWRTSQNAPMRCMAIDMYNRVADNLCAVAATLEAMRAIERHGGAQVQERSFRGFTALPQNTGARPWREVLGLTEWVHRLPPKEAVEASWRRLALERHPDRQGGSHEAMAELNQARAEALKEIDG